MFAKLSSENLIKEHLARLNCTADFLAALAGIPPSRLSQAFRGIRALSNEDAICLDRVLTELDELVQAFKPIPVALTNPQQIRALLEETRDRRAEAFCVRFGRNFFVSKSGDLRTSFNLLQGTPMTRLLAEKVAATLKPDFPDAEIVRNSFASLDSIATEFSEVWQELKAGDHARL